MQIARETVEEVLAAPCSPVPDADAEGGGAGGVAVATAALCLALLAGPVHRLTPACAGRTLHDLQR
ncbi:hypothetical protein ACIOFV_52500 [Streptomyces mirabilis]|uniref:hypothetical protein n=1 Tax=Streptomyces mirabilis TaxID=68239 RepID=UPI00381E0F70